MNHMDSNSVMYPLPLHWNVAVFDDPVYVIVANPPSPGLVVKPRTGTELVLLIIVLVTLNEPQRLILTRVDVSFRECQVVMLNGNVVLLLIPVHAPPIVIVRAVAEVDGAVPMSLVELSVIVFAELSTAVTTEK